MNQQSFQFPSAIVLCQFLREVRLQRFLLLGKKSILIADFPLGADTLAQQRYGAVLASVPEEEKWMAGVAVKECRVA